MRQYLEKYKYHLGGVSITLIILYVVYDTFFNKDVKKEIKKEINQEKNSLNNEKILKDYMIYMKSFKKEIQKLSQAITLFNENQIKNSKKDIFNKDITKKSILIDSISAYKDGQNTSNYVVNFGGSNSPEVYNNVVGFRLVNAIVPYTIYTINDHNKIFTITISSSPTTVTLDNGSYTFVQLGNHLQDRINAAYNSTDYTVTSDITTYKYTIADTSASPTNFKINWSQFPECARLFGFEKDTDKNNSHSSKYSVDHSIHYVDLVINEIPGIACKMSSKGKEIIARIPFTNVSGGLIYYRAPEGELQSSNYFFPIKLSSLTIQLFDDNGNEYDSNNGDNYFEFEISIVNESLI
jgi:hypothetical protein